MHLTALLFSYVMYGDESVYLTRRYPWRRLIFFYFSVTCIFIHLFGQYFGSHASSERGAILGHLKVFGGTNEPLERGNLSRGRFVIRLLGEFIRLSRASSPNPPSG